MSLKTISRLFAYSPRYLQNARALNINTVNKEVVKSSYSIRGHLNTVSDQLRKRMAAGEKLPFDSIIPCNIGNPLAVGKDPLTFPRDVVSCIENTKLLNSADISEEAKDRAKQIIASTGGRFGGYTKSQGIEIVRQHIAEFMYKRDGYPCKPDDIYLSDGASSAISFLMTLLIQHNNVGIMTPFPTYPVYTSEAAVHGGKIVPFYLRESNNWSLDIEELVRAYNLAIKEGIDVRCMVIINPCNPTGHVLRPETMRTIVDFCEQNNILLIADEVYQDVVYNKERPFYSFKKIASQMKSNIQLVSLHSISKGFMGECGHRGGYFELYHFPEDVKAQIFKMATFGLCPNAVGQVIVDCMVHPPEAPENKAIWESERNSYITKLQQKSVKLAECFNSLPGIKCKPADGGWYLFPALSLPLKALEAAKSCRWQREVMPPDFFWCLKLLEETGVIVVPGSGFGQVPGTFHFRSTFLPEDEKFDQVIERITKFQNEFMTKYD
ncbi:aminotransferase, classes I and II family protein [Trichomonas vaginalis G3]|uniref:Aminotransferase, classes I and II family protein n=1 Tax=Trichomonas vaginalis (strain ATCC PRA-98 / G3) TaxID=412133 RepID=A2E7I0_TRIV3|nr:alanine aminotransferase family [Trichomonas vaginalis G3]EAY11373.1 aminotransferase, classes I and II family protein [Trichomonas vaginalis G3]KAI5530538.1 alanine aminotransferase family [Trichomonas vaginalis G3]|eukprot:XP_001323596.1 aminotransferase, classes I and II family protein [Trichomonas vaginalis G3]